MKKTLSLAMLLTIVIILLTSIACEVKIEKSSLDKMQNQIIDIGCSKFVSHSKTTNLQT